MSTGEDQGSAEKLLNGTAAAPGINHGIVHVLRPEEDEPPSYEITEDEVDSEIARLEQALFATRAQIRETQEIISESIGAADASIFDAHLLVVEDQTLIDEVIRIIREERYNAEHVFSRVTQRYIKTLSAIDDQYLRERSMDIQDVSRRVIRNLLGQERRVIAAKGPFILIAEDLTPSETATLDRENVLGFATESGSRTSHTAIMARSLGIPAVVALRGLLDQVKSGDTVLIDGYGGHIVINPTSQTLYTYGAIESRREEVSRSLDALRDTACATIDGRAITLSANIEIADEIDAVKEHGARGVGLYRTEFFFLNRSGLPDEDEQAENYTSIAQALHPEPLIIRTLDLGGDKILDRHGYEAEDNPFLGWRAIRFCLEETGIFKTQMRAILRASIVGNVKMMYPMISSIDELRKANALLEECRNELRDEGVEFSDDFEVGAMIEVPTAAVCADVLARESDFFSIGTNDLIQYATAVDRVNERVANLYAPTHPGVLRLMKGVVDAGHAAGIWVGVCGEMAGEIAYTPLLVGLGVDELSTGSSIVPSVKRAVQTLDFEACALLVNAALQMETASEILHASLDMARERFPELLA
jgi:phosphotransferase system enzyme I (PtsI)